MADLKWSPAEKKVARRAFDAALELKLAQVLSELKARAAAAATPSDLWAIEDFLRHERRAIDDAFDYRYSQLPMVFGRLIAAGLMTEADLAGLADDKLEVTRRIVRARAE
jgi:hypothetical protein